MSTAHRTECAQKVVLYGDTPRRRQLFIYSCGMYSLVGSIHPQHSLSICLFLRFSGAPLPSISHALTQYLGGGLKADGGGRDVDKWERGVSNDLWGVGGGQSRARSDPVLLKVL